MIGAILGTILEAVADFLLTPLGDVNWRGLRAGCLRAWRGLDRQNGNLSRRQEIGADQPS